MCGLIIKVLYGEKLVPILAHAHRSTLICNDTCTQVISDKSSTFGDEMAVISTNFRQEVRLYIYTELSITPQANIIS